METSLLFKLLFPYMCSISYIYIYVNDAKAQPRAAHAALLHQKGPLRIQGAMKERLGTWMAPSSHIYMYVYLHIHITVYVFKYTKYIQILWFSIGIFSHTRHLEFKNCFFFLQLKAFHHDSLPPVVQRVPF